MPPTIAFSRATGDVPEAHRLEPSEVLDRLASTPDGLSQAEAAERLVRFGPNELRDKGSKKPLVILWEQLTAVMVVILIGAALLSFALGKLLEAFAIGAIVVLFALLGFVQEYRAEQAIAALRQMASPTVRVLRSGRTSEIDAADIVPGDLVLLEAGSIVPADLRLVEAANLRIQEATLTGESEAVEKDLAAIDADDVPLGDRRSMAYAGTQVTYGRGVGVTVATGMQTELGRIAGLLQDVESDRTPLQERLDQVGKQLALLGAVVAALVVAMGLAAGEPVSDLVLTAISVAVAVIPEGLPAVVTFTLAIGAQRMLGRQALIRKLPAVETLGSVTVICSDKTGTLTQNRMTATVVDLAGHRIDLDGTTSVDPEAAPALVLAMVAATLCNDADVHLEADGTLVSIGDPTETALVHAAHDLGLDVVALRRLLPRIAENPFDSDRKRMSTAHDALDNRIEALHLVAQDRPLVFVKGAVDGLLAHATHVWDQTGAVDLGTAWRDRILAANDDLAATGLRVLGIAFRPLHPTEDTARLPTDAAESGLTILGLVGIIDPPRAEVRDAVATCRAAGIRAVMITGDHPLTAKAIATELRMSENDRVLTGADLDQLTVDEFAAAAREVSVFARVSPEHKLRLVQSMQDQGAIVAMTGDGVNDAPALKRADIGVAMGMTGTDVSKEASDMVLRDDDNFTTIVAAVEEGRVIYDNLRRFVGFAVAGNLGKIIVMLGWPIPLLLAGGEIEGAVALLPLQLLWLNLMTDGLLGLSMGVEPAEKGLMQRAPTDPSDGLWAGGLGRRTLWTGLAIGAAALGVGFAYRAADLDTWQTMMFTTLAFLQIFQAIGTRSSHESLTSIGWRSNPLLLAVTAGVAGLQVLAVVTPLRNSLGLDPLRPVDWLVAVGLGAALLIGLEIAKLTARSRR